jgi:alpha-glucosidase (family GH31 glycosyl hydrolase)
VIGGGNVDLIIFAGPSPQQVIKQLTKVIGRPAMQEEWVFGLHQSRFGYKNIEELKQTVVGYKNSGIQLDGIWFDIDYMDSYQDFTLDPVNFPPNEVAEFIAKEKGEGRKAICLIDPGIKVDPALKSFRDGIEMGIFMKDIEGKEYKGEVWPGATHFIDFFHPNVTKYLEFN